MTNPPRAQVSSVDLVTFFLAGMGGIVAGNLTWLALVRPETFLEHLRLPLVPGLYAVWLMAGDAQGNVVPDGWVPPAAVFLNAVVYAAAVMVPRLLWCHITRRDALRPRD